MSDRIPVTVLTGYLGAGKTTLLNRILRETHGRRYAVIVNEFGEIGIDGDLIVAADEDLFEMSNGCICCTVRGDLIRTLHGLFAGAPPAGQPGARADAPDSCSPSARPGQPGARSPSARPGARFDAIIVETTGLADPGPVIQTFFVDPELLARTRLDSVTTVVDARHIGLRLADSREAAEQIAFADQIVLNKIEMVREEELVGIEGVLRSLNPWAPIHRTSHADVALDTVLGRGGFDLDRIDALGRREPDHSHDETRSHPHDETCAHPHDEHCGHSQTEGHVHDSGIASVSLSSSRPMSRPAIELWLSELFANQGQNILRAKGIIDIAGEDRRLVFQAVHMLLDGDLQRPWAEGEQRTSRLVFIGRHLDRDGLSAGFDGCAAGR